MRFPVSALPLKKIRAFILLDVRPSSKAPRGRKGSLFAMLFLRNKGPAKRIGTLKGCNDFPGCGLSLSDTRSHTLYLLFARIVYHWPFLPCRRPPFFSGFGFNPSIRHLKPLRRF